MPQQVKSEPTVDSIRKELRDALSIIALHLSCAIVTNNKDNASTVRDTMTNMAAFGVNSGLFTMDEFNDWKKTIKDGVIIHVKKYLPEFQE